MLVQTPSGQMMVVPDNHLGLTEYSLPSVGGIPGQPLPPPPPPPPVKHIGIGEAPLGGGELPSPPGTVPAPALNALPGDIPSWQPGQTPDIGAVPAPAQLAPLPLAQPDFKARAPAPQGKGVPAPKPMSKDQRTEADIAAAGADAAAAVQKQSVAAQGVSAAEAGQQTAIAGAEQTGLTDADTQREVAEAVRNKRAEEYAAKRQGIDNLVKKEADTKIDEGRLWRNAGTGRKILAGISVALSGLSDILLKRTGPNAAMGIIKGAIDDDVAAQVRERDQLSKRIGYARNSLDDYRQETGDVMEAHKLKLSEGYDRTAAKIRIIAGRYGSDVAKARGEQLAGQFEQQAAQLRQQTSESVFNRDTKRQELANSRASIGLQAQANAQRKTEFEWQKKKEIIAIQQAAEKSAQGGIVGTLEQGTDKDGKPVVTAKKLLDKNGNVWNPDDKVKEKVLSMRDGIQALHEQMGQVKALSAKYGGSSKWTSPDVQAEYNRLVGSAVREYAKAYNLPMGDEADRASARDELFGSDPSAYRGDEVGERINRTLREQDTKFNRSLIHAGYDGGQTVTFADFSERPGAAPLNEDKEVVKVLGKYDAPGNFNDEKYKPQGDKLQVLQTFQTMANSKDPEISRMGVARLNVAAEESADATVRGEAKRMLGMNAGVGEGKGTSNLPPGHITSPAFDEGATRKGAREEAPPPVGTPEYVEYIERMRKRK